MPNLQMNTRFLPFAFLCSLVFSIGVCQADQLPSALINSIYPPSGTRGTEVELTTNDFSLETPNLPPPMDTVYRPVAKLPGIIPSVCRRRFCSIRLTT